MVGLRLIIRLNCGFGLVRDGVFGVDEDNVLICENNGDRSECEKKTYVKALIANLTVHTIDCKRRKK